MPRSITLSPADRKTLLQLYRRPDQPDSRLRVHILLLLDDGHPWAVIAAVLFTSTSTIGRWLDRFRHGGIPALTGRPPGRPSLRARWAAVVVGWVVGRAPADFGLARSRWSCEAAALVLREERGASVSRETVRRWRQRADLVWRRPRPVLRPTDPDRPAKLRALRHLLGRLPADETAVFMDEVEVHTNPKIGCMGMPRGRQAEVGTPGTNARRVLAGSIHWRTGRVFLTTGRARAGTRRCSWRPWTTCGRRCGTTG